MIMLRMMTGVVAGVARWLVPTPPPVEVGGATASDIRAAEALAAMRDANAAAEAGAAEAALGGCYHDGVAYSLGYDANGVVELDGRTFTSLNTGMDGGAAAALREHRQNFDPSRDIPRFIVALKPVRIVMGRKDGEAYGLPPGPQPIKAEAVRKSHITCLGKPPSDKGCVECTSPYCECDGSCDPDFATSCHLCDRWVCGHCVVEGACHDCFSKMQGGVN